MIFFPTTFNPAEGCEQYCTFCGRKVSLGSGLFVNRVPDCNDFITKFVYLKRKFPFGEYVCRECDESEQ